jgi:hypothetical protein
MLIVVNFQSWLDPFIIITALPAALCGIILFLFFTHTTLSVPALDRRHHVHGRGDREQHSGDFVREGAPLCITATLYWRRSNRASPASGRC